MHTKNLVSLCKTIHVMAGDELERKAPDYAPDDVCFVDLIRQCAEANIARPEKLLWALMSKHTTALRSFCVNGVLVSETLANRTFDTINFASIIYVWALQSAPILRSVWNYFENQPCECQNIDEVCDRCLVLDWYARYHESSRMAST